MHYVRTSQQKHNEAQQKLRLPDFFVIGSAKCGTTTLYKYLCRHPDVFMSTPKEMSFFSKDEVYQRGIEWYAELFADAKSNQTCGEASTTYTRWPFHDKTVERLVKVQPDARLIYIVRDPTERLFSFYAHRMRETVTTTFEDFVANTPEAVDSGQYMNQINQYLEVFRREQLLVLFTKDMKREPQTVLKKAGEFLGLSTFDYLQAGPIQANQGGGKHYASTALTRTIRGLKRAPLVTPLLNRVPPSVRKSGYDWLANGPVGKRLRRRHQNNMTTLTPQLRQRIQAIYRENVEQLEEFTGRSLPEWKGNAS